MNSTPASANSSAEGGALASARSCPACPACRPGDSIPPGREGASGSGNGWNSVRLRRKMTATMAASPIATEMVR